MVPKLIFKATYIQGDMIKLPPPPLNFLSTNPFLPSGTLKTFWACFDRIFYLTCNSYQENPSLQTLLHLKWQKLRWHVTQHILVYI